MVVVSHDRHFRRKVAETELELENGRLVPYAARCRHAVPFPAAAE